MYAATLYDAVYLYLTLAMEVIKKGGNINHITDGKAMYKRAINYRLTTGEYCFVDLRYRC